MRTGNTEIDGRVSVGQRLMQIVQVAELSEQDKWERTFHPEGEQELYSAWQ